MKLLTSIFRFWACALVCLMLPMVAFADAAPAAPSAADIQSLLTAIGGLPGAGALAIVAVVVQGLMLLAKSQLGEKLVGLYQILLLEALTMVGGVVALKISGQSWGAAVMNSQTLAAAQVFGHQFITQVVQHQSPSAPTGTASAPAASSTPSPSA